MIGEPEAASPPQPEYGGGIFSQLAMLCPSSILDRMRLVNGWLVDGLHDYANVARDFHHFAPWIQPGGRVAFHDYGGHFVGVKKFVDELAIQGDYQMTEQAHSLVVLEKKKELHGISQ